MYLDGIVLKLTWAGEVRNVSVLVAIGLSMQGYRKILGVIEGAKEDKAGWTGFLRHLKKRGLKGLKLAISVACPGLLESASAFFPGVNWQRCILHFYKNVFIVALNITVKEAVMMLKAIHASEDLAAALEKAEAVIAKLDKMKLRQAAQKVKEDIQETLSYYDFPCAHWQRLRTNNPLERIMREIRRRANLVGAFPDGNTALMLVAARLRHIAGTRWSTNRYLNIVILKEMEM